MGVKKRGRPFLPFPFLILAIFALFSTLFLFSVPAGFSPFPSENEYVWCFAKRTLPQRLSQDISDSKIPKISEMSAMEVRALCETPLPEDSFRECRRISSILADMRSDWARAQEYSKAEDMWTGFSSINNAEASVAGYQKALSSAGDLEGELLLEIDKGSLGNISGLVGKSSSGETFLSLKAKLSLSKESQAIQNEISKVSFFRSQIDAYYSHFRVFADSAHTSHIFRTDCSALSNWSLFECSSPGWVLINVACAGNPSSCVLGTDCEATIANNLSSIKGYLPDFSYFWQAHDGKRISSAVSLYSAYSELYLRAQEKYLTDLAGADTLSRQVSNLLSEARFEMLPSVPAGVVREYLASRGLGSASAETLESGNFSKTVTFAEQALANFQSARESLDSRPLGERILLLRESLAELSSAKGALEESFSKASLVEAKLDSIVSREVSEALFSRPLGLRIFSKSAYLEEDSEKDKKVLSSLKKISCAPKGTVFPDENLLGLAREGEGLGADACSGSPSTDSLFSSLSSEYERKVNALRWDALSDAGIPSSARAEILSYEFLAPGGWVSPETAWGFLAFLERKYSEALELSDSQGFGISISESLPGVPIANKEAFSEISVTVRAGLKTLSGKAEATSRFFGAGTTGQFQQTWGTPGCTVSARSTGSKILSVLGECERPLEYAEFSLERPLGILARSERTYFSESATSLQYSIESRYSVSCTEGINETLLGTGIMLPEDRLSADFPLTTLGGELFLKVPCARNETEISAEILYANPIASELEISFEGNDSSSPIKAGVARISAKNLLGRSLKRVKVFFRLTENSSDVRYSGREIFPQKDGRLFLEADFSAGETREFEVTFLSSGDYSIPECSFCCDLASRFRALPSGKRAEASESLEKISANYRLVAKSQDRQRIGDLVCSDLFNDALLLSEEVLRGQEAQESKSNCSEASAAALSDRRALAALSDRIERVRLLRKKFPFGNFDNPPDLSQTAFSISKGENSCDISELRAAEEGFSGLSSMSDLSIESAALWAASEFSGHDIGPEISGEIVERVEKRVGNRTRTLFSGKNLGLPRHPAPSEYTSIIDTVVAASKEIAPTSELLLRAEDAIAGAERTDRGASGEIYLGKAKQALSEGRLLDSYFLAHYSKIVSEEEAKKLSSSGNGALMAKLAVAALSIALAAGIIFAGRRKKGGKAEKGDSLFGEIR